MRIAAPAIGVGPLTASLPVSGAGRPARRWRRARRLLGHPVVSSFNSRAGCALSAFIDRIETWLRASGPSLSPAQRVIGRIYAIRRAEELAVARMERLAAAGHVRRVPVAGARTSVAPNLDAVPGQLSA